MVFFFEDQIESDEPSLMRSTNAAPCIYLRSCYQCKWHRYCIQLSTLFFKGLCDVAIMMRLPFARGAGCLERARVTRSPRLKKNLKYFLKIRANRAGELRKSRAAGPEPGASAAARGGSRSRSTRDCDRSCERTSRATTAPRRAMRDGQRRGKSTRTETPCPV
jgi:hypothetical protein